MAFAPVNTPGGRLTGTPDFLRKVTTMLIFA
jgi:hypothetical protein